MEALRLPALAIISIATFIIAAKSHGQQVRLVREAAGYHQVVFGGSNPEFVEKLWRRDRLHYWPTFALVFLAVALARWFGVGPAGPGFTAWALWFIPFVAAFTVAGLTADSEKVWALWLLVVGGGAAALALFFTAA